MKSAGPGGPWERYYSLADPVTRERAYEAVQQDLVTKAWRLVRRARLSLALCGRSCGRRARTALSSGGPCRVNPEEFRRGPITAGRAAYGPAYQPPGRPVPVPSEALSRGWLAVP